MLNIYIVNSANYYQKNHEKIGRFYYVGTYSFRNGTLSLKVQYDIDGDNGKQTSVNKTLTFHGLSDKLDTPLLGGSGENFLRANENF